MNLGYHKPAILVEMLVLKASVAIKEIHIEASTGLEAKRKTDRREGEIGLFPLALYLLYRYPNISGLTLFLNRHFLFFYHGIFFSAFLSEGSLGVDHCFVIWQSKHLHSCIQILQGYLFV